MSSNQYEDFFDDDDGSLEKISHELNRPKLISNQFFQNEISFGEENVSNSSEDEIVAMDARKSSDENRKESADIIDSQEEQEPMDSLIF